jgi:hypothetical protein
MPVMLYMHERGNVIGKWSELVEDGDGLKSVGQVAKAAKNPAGVPIYDLLKMGAINGLSIGFRVKKHSLDEEQKLREILEVELGEVSVVDIPGGPSARVTDVKSSDVKNPKFLERVLRDAGLSRVEAKALIAEGLPALRDVAADPEKKQRDADSKPVQSVDSDLVSSMKELAASIKR